MDPNSLSNCNELGAKSYHLALVADFDRKVLRGYVEVKAEAITDSVAKLVLDTKDITVSKVTCCTASETGVVEKEAKYSMGEPHEVFGTPLIITFDAVAKNAKTHHRVYYETSEKASALQWLDANQTAGKKHPFLFTQCQAIHARTMVPCQDAPMAKAPYTADITVKKPLVALMSALSTGSTENGDSVTYHFEQKIPMPSYLIALAIGNLESRDIGPRSKVWSEPETVARGEEEFNETEMFIKTAEEIVKVPYVWGKYDILLLPPSFAYGGMENPTLTFITPTVLSGDRANVDVVAHEISHSWFGNLVTNKTWEHFWLNEGFTTFLERKIIGRVRGEPMFHFSAIRGNAALQGSIDAFGADNPLTALVPDLKGIDPDDAFSSVPYNKGMQFLYYLQGITGKEEFEGFLNAYIENYKYKCLTTEDFKAFFLNHFKSHKSFPDLEKVDWNTWFTKPGMPIVKPNFDDTLERQCIDLAEKWAKDSSTSCDISSWPSQQVVVFLDKLKAGPALSEKTLDAMDAAYKFSTSQNYEVIFRWCIIGIKAEYKKVVPLALHILKSQGRMKFTRPLYRELFNSKMGKQDALDLFASIRGTYHGICQKMVAKDLKLE